MKDWLFQPYKHLYASPTYKRIMVGSSVPFRVLYEGSWRKPSGIDDMYSAESGIIVRFKDEKDLSVLTRSFAPVRIAFVVKDGSKFVVKLMLLASRSRFIVATGLNDAFDRNTAKKNYQWKTTLILALPSNDNLCVAVMGFPPHKIPRRYELQYDVSTKKFVIPDDLDVATTPAASAAEQPDPNDCLVDKATQEVSLLIQ